MNKKLLWGVLPVLLFAGIATSCSDDKDAAADGASLAMTFSNKLSAGDKANLSLVYDGTILKGKQARLSSTDGQTATLRLYGVLPGDSCTVIDGVRLDTRDEGYSFSGTATAGNVPTTFRFEGTTSTDDGTMSLELSDVRVPQNVLGEHGTFALPVYNGTEGEDERVTVDGVQTSCVLFRAPVYSKLVTKHADETNLVSLAWTMMLNTVLNNLITSVLDEVTFAADGNITAQYKSLNDTVGFQQLMDYQGLAHPEKSEFSASPKNLAMYYFTDARTMYVVPNVDMIMAQVQADKAGKSVQVRETAPSSTTGKLADVAGVLTALTTEGVRLTVEANPYKTPAEYDGQGYYSRYEGDLVAYTDLTDLKSLMSLFDALRGIIPEETLQKDIFELLEEKNIKLPAEAEEYLPMIKALLPDTTVGGILNALESNLDDFETLQIGFYLNK